jgi:hypothetical protein
VSAIVFLCHTFAQKRANFWLLVITIRMVQHLVTMVYVHVVIVDDDDENAVFGLGNPCSIR